jgi:hypothetical protein
MTLHGLNYWAVLIGIIFTFASGAIWFGPKTFYPKWMAAMGINPSDNIGKVKPSQVFSALVVAIVLQVFVIAAIITTLKHGNSDFGAADGAIVGFLLGAVICAMPNLSHRMCAGNGFKVWLIENGNDILNMTVVAAIIAGLN